MGNWGRGGDMYGFVAAVVRKSCDVAGNRGIGRLEWCLYRDVSLLQMTQGPPFWRLFERASDATGHEVGFKPFENV